MMMVTTMITRMMTMMGDVDNKLPMAMMCMRMGQLSSISRAEPS